MQQHRSGRTLNDILGDRRLQRLGSSTLIWKVACEPQTIAMLEADVTEDIKNCMATLHRDESNRETGALLNE